MSAEIPVFDAEVVRDLPQACTVRVRLQPKPSAPLGEWQECWVPAGTSLNDAAIAAGIDLYPGAWLRLYLNGLPVPDEEWDGTAVYPGDVIVARYDPGLDPFTWAMIIGGTAMAGSLTAGTLGIGMLFVLYALTAITWMVVGYVISLVVSLIFPPPPPPKSDNRQAANAYAITGSSNQMDPWSPVSKVYGRHLCYPKLGTRPYTRLEGAGTADQYYFMLGVIGRGKYTIEKVSTGNNPIADNPQAECQIVDDPVTEKQTLLASQVDEKGLSIKFKAFYGIDKPSEEVTTDSGQKLSIDLIWASGIRYINKAGGHNEVTVALAISIRKYDSNTGDYVAGSVWEWPDWSGPMGGMVSNTKVDDRRASGGSTTTLVDSSQDWATNQWAGWDIVCNGQTRRIVSNDKTSLTVSATWPTPTSGAIYSFYAPKTWQIVNDTPSPVRLTLAHTVSDAHCYWAVRISRIGTVYERGHYTKEQGGESIEYERDKKGNIKYDKHGNPKILGSTQTGQGNTGAHMSDVAWGALRMERFDAPINLTNVACIAAKFKASDRLTGMVEDLNCMVYSWLYDITPAGALGPLIETRNPALVLLDLWIGDSTYEQDRISIEDIDLDTLYLLKERCEPVIRATTCTAAGGADTLTDSNGGWVQNEHQDQYVTIRPGQGNEERRRVKENTPTMLTVTPAWTVPPAQGAPYELRRYRFALDRYIQGDMTIEDIEKDVLSVARATYQLSEDGKHSVVWDDPQTTPTQTFTSANVRNFTWARSLQEKPHALAVTYVNPHKRWQEDVFHVYADGYNKDGSGGKARAIDIQPMPVHGITDPLILYREARYRLKNGELRDTLYKFETDFEFLNCRRGDLVRIQHPCIIDTAAAGYVEVKNPNPSTGLIESIFLDRPVVFELGKEYGIIVRRSGTVALQNNHYETALPLWNPATELNPRVETNEVVFETEQGNNYLVPNPGDLWTFGLLGEETLLGIVLSIKPKRGLEAEIEVMDYAPEIYDVDSEPLPAEWGTVLVPFDPRDVPPNPPIIERVAFAYVDDYLAVYIDLRENLTLNPTSPRVPVKGFQANVRYKNLGEQNADGAYYGDQPWVSSSMHDAITGVTTIEILLTNANIWSQVELRAYAVSPWGTVSAVTEQSVTIRTAPTAEDITFTEMIVPEADGSRRFLRVSWLPSSPEFGDLVWYVDWASGEYAYSADPLTNHYFDIPDPLPGLYTFAIFSQAFNAPSLVRTAEFTYSPEAPEDRPLPPSGFEILGQGLDHHYTGRDIQLGWNAQTPVGVDPPEIGDEPGGANSALGVTAAGERYDLEVRDPVNQLAILQTVQDLTGDIVSYLYSYDQRVPEAKLKRELELVLYRETAAGIRSLPARIRVTNPSPKPLNAVAVSASPGGSDTGTPALVHFDCTVGEGFDDDDAVRIAVWGSTAGATFTPGPSNYLGMGGEKESKLAVPVTSNTAWWFKLGVVDRFSGEARYIANPASDLSLLLCNIDTRDALAFPVGTGDIEIGAILEQKSSIVSLSDPNMNPGTYYLSGSCSLDAGALPIGVAQFVATIPASFTVDAGNDGTETYSMYIEVNNNGTITSYAGSTVSLDNNYNSAWMFAAFSVSCALYVGGGMVTATCRVYVSHTGSGQRTFNTKLYGSLVGTLSKTA